MIQVRPLKQADLKQVSDLIRSQADGADFKRFGLSSTDEQILKNLSDGMCFGLFKDSHLAAIILGRNLSPPKNEKNGDGAFEIDLTMTHQNYLRQGLMKRLFHSIFNNLKDFGILKIWLEVHEENASAIALYKAQGFIEEGLRPRYYPDQKAAILMTCML